MVNHWGDKFKERFNQNDIVDNSILYAEGNACGIIAIISIEITFDNYHIHVLHDLPKRYIYGYFIF